MTAPAPLTPPDCDLRDFRNMPLDVQRFRDSDLVTEEDPETVLAAIFLWGTAWQQLPAASLPNDDRALARFAGYGRSLSHWHEVRDGALRGFVLCSDGRLYHPVLAEKAIAAWDKRLRLQWTKAKDRHRKAEKDLSPDDRTPFPEFDEWKATREVPDHKPGNQPRLPLEPPPSSAGTKSSRARAPIARADRARAPAHTEEAPNPEKPNKYSNGSDGNEGDFRRNGAVFPLENALKEKGKGKEKDKEKNPDPIPDHIKGPRDPFPAKDVVELHHLVCEAAGYRPTSPTQIAASMDEVREWFNRGLDFEKVVLPAIRAVVAQSKPDDRTRTLGRFRHAIAREEAKSIEAKASGRKHVPTASPILDPKDEDPRFRPLRAALLERCGAASYTTSFNSIRFTGDDVEFGAEKNPLYVNGPDYQTEPLVHGNYAPILKAVAKPLGFTELRKGYASVPLK